jgi:hypothetical protein
MAIEPKIFIVPLNKQEYLVRARTKAGAVNGLLKSLAGAAKENARQATYDEVFRLGSEGAKIFDAADQEDPGMDAQVRDESAVDEKPGDEHVDGA